MYYLWIIVFINLSLVCGNELSYSCKTINNTAIICKCEGNEEFSLPVHFNYENFTSLTISSCASADLHFYSLPNANSIVDITIENISKSLSFDAMLVSPKMRTFHIKNVGKIISMNHHTFININSMDVFKIEDTTIENFDEQFTGININTLIFKNVIVEQVSGINLSSKRGKSLQIINTVIRNITAELKFAKFESIDLVNSTFEFQKGGEMSIDGTSAKIYNCNFYNVSLNIVTNRNIVVKNNCADGNSSLRLNSKILTSIGNRLPTQIIYMTKNKEESVQENNNTVCIAGDCKCPKSIRRNSSSKLNFNTLLGVILMLVLYGLL